MGLLGAESVVQSPRQSGAAMNKNIESIGGSGPRGGAIVSNRTGLQRSMMAYTEKARILMSTSLPEGINYGPRFFQQKAFFSPVTWSQPSNATNPQGYDLDYSFPHFKERESMIGVSRREQPQKSAVKLYIGKEHEQEKGATPRERSSPVKFTARRKSRRSSSVASIQTEKSRGRQSLATIRDDDKASHLSFGTTNAPSIAAPYRLALDAGSGGAGASESETSGPVLHPESLPENRSAKLQHGAYSMGRMFPPRSTHRKLPSIDDDRHRKRNYSHHNTRQAPLYLLVGKSESMPNRLDQLGKDSSRLPDNIDEIDGNPIDKNPDLGYKTPSVEKLQADISDEHQTMPINTENTIQQIDIVGKNNSLESQNDTNTGSRDNDVNQETDTKIVKKRGKNKEVVHPNVINLMPVQ